jgi:putative hemolysin
VENFIFIFFLLILLLCSAYFSSSETALFSLPSTKVKAYRRDPDPRKRLVAHLILQPRDLLVTVFMLNTLVNILIQNVASSMFVEGWLFKVGFPLTVTLIFGEIIPKYFGLQHNSALAYAFAPSIQFLQRFLSPVRRFVVTITAPISRGIFFFLKKEESISREELQHVLKTSEAHGVLKPEEAELVWGYIDLQESLVREVMRPREDFVSYEINEPLTKLNWFFGEKKKSQIPVYEKEIDNILGIISAKQYFLHQREINSSDALRKRLARPFYIPENTSVRLLLRRMQEKKEAMAIVVDEYGSIAGLITQDDILEEVIGKSTAESSQNALYTRSGENEIIASGKLELSDFDEIFNVDLESESHHVTLGGWLTEKIGDIPKSGQKYKSNEFLFQILAADPNRVRRIYVRRLTKKSSNNQRNPR